MLQYNIQLNLSEYINGHLGDQQARSTLVKISVKWISKLTNCQMFDSTADVVHAGLSILLTNNTTLTKWELRSLRYNCIFSAYIFCKLQNNVPHYPANTLPCKYLQLAIVCHHLLLLKSPLHTVTY